MLLRYSSASSLFSFYIKQTELAYISIFSQGNATIVAFGFREK